MNTPGGNLLGITAPRRRPDRMVGAGRFSLYHLGAHDTLRSPRRDFASRAEALAAAAAIALAPGERVRIGERIAPDTICAIFERRGAAGAGLPAQQQIEPGG